MRLKLIALIAAFSQILLLVSSVQQTMHFGMDYGLFPPLFVILLQIPLIIFLFAIWKNMKADKEQAFVETPGVGHKTVQTRPQRLWLMAILSPFLCVTPVVIVAKTLLQSSGLIDLRAYVIIASGMVAGTVSCFILAILSIARREKHGIWSLLMSFVYVALFVLVVMAACSRKI